MNQDEIMENLVCSLLAVNNYSLEKAWGLRQGLREELLLDVGFLKKASHDTLFERLKKAGYDKSDYVVGLVADRLHNLGKALDEKTLRALVDTVEKRDEGKMEEILLPVKGIGPVVLRNFAGLCGVVV